MGIQIERAYPCVFGVLAGALYYWFRDLVVLPDTFSELLAAVLTISGIAVGFLATAQSIIYSRDEGEVIKKLKQVDYYKNVVHYIGVAIHGAFVLGIASTVLILWNPDLDQSTIARWTFGVWLALLVTMAACCYRVIQILHKIMKSL